MMSTLFLGLLIGMRHAIEADHLAAVASLTTKSTSYAEAIRLGATWGVGHTLTLFLFGSIVMFSNTVIPNDLALLLEFTVGIMLIILGIDVLRRMKKERIHFHLHQHEGGIQHFHAHSHTGEDQHTTSSHEHQHRQKIALRPLLVGMMHGMAGSAALIVLVLQTVESAWTGMLYILYFGIGSIIGMALLASIIMIPLRYSALKLNSLYHGMQFSIAIATISMGLYIMYDAGFVEGLMI